MTPLGLTATIVFGADQSPPSRPARRRLAQNVICLFHDDRLPVVNTRRRGRMPHNVRKLEIPPFAIGDIVEVFYANTNPNNGTQVKIIEYFPVEDEFTVEAVIGLLHTFDENHKPNGQGKRALTLTKNLRRISRLSRQ